MGMWEPGSLGCDPTAAAVTWVSLSSPLESRWFGRLSLSLFFPAFQAAVEAGRGDRSPPGGSSPPLSGSRAEVLTSCLGGGRGPL